MIQEWLGAGTIWPDHQTSCRVPVLPVIVGHNGREHEGGGGQGGADGPDGDDDDGQHHWTGLAGGPGDGQVPAHHQCYGAKLRILYILAKLEPEMFCVSKLDRIILT